MLKSLEKLKRDFIIKLNPDEIVNGILRKIADEIQAEVNEKYVPRVGAAYQMLADPKLDDEAVNSAYEILKEHGSLDAYIDKFYLPRPLFEDGKPAQFGDRFEHSGGIDAFLFLEDGWREVWSRGERFVLQPGERLSRPPESDTQKKIDADVARIAHGYATNTSVEESMAIEIEVLLARQRKLDGVE